MASVYSVTQINSYIRNMFATDYALRRVSIRGEVSNLKYHSSGHIYFTLKDDGSSISSVMFAGKRAEGLKFRMTEGQKVVVSGSVEVYTKTGQYQLYAAKIEAEGQGDLFRRYEELRNRLQEMGLFDESYKKPIPRYARHVGIVTASTGAAIHDIMNVSARRNPYVQLTLCPAQVQGEGAAASIAAAIRKLDALHPDVMIVGRGGGSIEDLWAFNEEEVAKAIFRCETPVISAVGHEVDWTIADFTADLRAPTPSAAAELAVFDYALFCSQLSEARRGMRNAAAKKLDRERSRLDHFRQVIELHSPGRVLNEKRQNLAEMSDAMMRALEMKISDRRRVLESAGRDLGRQMERKLEMRKNELRVLAGRLDGMSPLRKVSGGFGFLTDGTGARIESVGQVKSGETLHIRVSDGKIRATVEDTEKTGGIDG